MFGKLKSLVGFHSRCLGFELLNLLFCHDWLFKLAGRWNGRTHLIKAVFVTYPANGDYASAYSYSWRRKRAKWRPHLAGIFFQNDKWGIMFAVSAGNEDFRDPDNFPRLKSLCQRMEQLRLMFRADQKTFGGILPAVLGKSRLIKEMHELEMTLAVTAGSLFCIRQIERLDFFVPVIVLAGSVSMIRRVREAFGGKCDKIIFINPRELADQGAAALGLAEISGRQALVVNLASGEELEKFSALLWPQAVILNEAYLRNMRELKAIFSGLDCRFYQIAGVKGRTYPRMPGVYSDAIPCCQGWIDPRMTPVLRKLD